MINVSISELTSLLKRAFESLGWTPGEYEDAANAVVWAETRGLYGVHRIIQAWPRLTNTNSQLQAEILETKSNITLDANGDSILRCGAHAVSLVHSNSYSVKCASLELRNCHDRGFILYNLSKCAQKGRSVYGRWHSPNYDYSAVIGPESFSASYIESPNDGKDQQLIRSLFLACSDNPDQVERFQEQHNQRLGQGFSHSIFSPTDMQLAAEHNLEKGLSVPRQSLTFIESMANKVLVPNSDQSRSGAGE